MPKEHRPHPAAVALAKLRAASLTAEERRKIASAGGKARKRSLTKEQRSASAKKAVEARWKKAKQK